MVPIILGDLPSVTIVNLVLARSRGYVNVDAVVPAKLPQNNNYNVPDSLPMKNALYLSYEKNSIALKGTILARFAPFPRKNPTTPSFLHIV